MSDICIISGIIIGAILAAVHFALTVCKKEDKEMGCDECERD